MSWADRRSPTRSFHYRSVRANGTVRKEYIGRSGDPVVRLIALTDELERADAVALNRAIEAEQQAFRAIAVELKRLDLRVRRLSRAWIALRGFYQRKGVWKTMPTKRRKQDVSVPGPLTQEKFEHLVEQAGLGRAWAAERLRASLEQHPEIWHGLADLTGHVEESLLRQMTRNDVALETAIRLKLEEVKASLRGNVPQDGLDALLAGQASVCWLEVEYARMGTYHAWPRNKDAKFWEKRYEQAQIRFQGLVSELIRLRELMKTSE